MGISGTNCIGSADNACPEALVRRLLLPKRISPVFMRQRAYFLLNFFAKVLTVVG